MLSVVVAELRLLTSVSGTEPEKVSCIDLLAVPLGHVPTIDSLKNSVLFSLNTIILLLTVSKNGANVPDEVPQQLMSLPQETKEEKEFRHCIWLAEKEERERIYQTSIRPFRKATYTQFPEYIDPRLRNYRSRYGAISND